MRSRALIALFLLVLTAAGGCGGDPGPASTSTALIPATPTQSQEASTPSDGDLVVPTIAPQGETATVAPIESPTIPDQPTPARLTSDATLTIVTLGDSLTEGDGDERPEGGGYPARLREMADRVRPGTQVLNLGKSGWDSGQLVSDQLPGAVAAKPQVALVWIGSNDLWNNNYPDTEESDRNNYTTNMDTILRTLTGAGARVYIALLDDQSKRPIASDTEGRYNAEGRALMSRRVVTYNDIIKVKAAEYGATTVDFYNTTIFIDPATLSEDGIHPNARGYDIIAEMWFRAIESDLAP